MAKKTMKSPWYPASIPGPSTRAPTPASVKFAGSAGATFTPSEKISGILADRAGSYDTEIGQAWQLAGAALNWFYSVGLLSRILLSSRAFAWIIILTKLVRIAQDPNHRDSWLDIGGYAQLVLADIDKRTPTSS